MGNVEKALFKCYEGKQQHLVALVPSQISLYGNQSLWKMDSGSRVRHFEEHTQSPWRKYFTEFLLVNMKLVNFQ